MAVSVAYGDSGTFFRMTSDADALRLQQQAATYNQAAYAQQMARNYQQIMNNAYQNVYSPRSQPKAIEQSTTSRVIADQGFGGGESRPRSRRYRKEPLRLSDVDAT